MFGKYNYIGLGQEMSSAVFTAPSIQLTQQNPNADEIQISGVKLRKESAYQNNVYFRDPLNNAYVNVGLSDENLSKLKGVFGENAIKSEGNQILLKGKAEEFVSSWYADIAYKRGYIRADENNDGFLNVEERKNTNSFTLGYMSSFGGSNIYLSGTEKYTQFFGFGSGDKAIIDKFTSSSIEEELNRMIELDKDMNGSISKNQIWETSDYVKTLDSIIDSSSSNCAMGIPSIEEAFFAFMQTMRDNKELAEKELQKAGIDTSAIDLNASVEEVFEKIMSQENGIKALNTIKEQLEKTQGSANLNETQEKTMSNSVATQENSTISFTNEQDEAIFNEMAKLTKLDKKTLAYNLANNPNFEEDIISIVQELAQSLDNTYALNLSSTSQKALDIRV